MSDSDIQTCTKSREKELNQVTAVIMLQTKKKNNLESSLLKIVVKIFQIINAEMQNTSPFLDYRGKMKMP